MPAELLASMGACLLPGSVQSPMGRCFFAPAALASHAGCASVCSAVAPSSLACIPSKSESDFVFRHLARGRKGWIGLHRRADRMDDDLWRDQWVSTECKTRFHNWGFQEPEAQFGREDCVAMDNNGDWISLGCHRAEYLCLCEEGTSTSPAYWPASAKLIERQSADAWRVAYKGLAWGVALVMIPAGHMVHRLLHERKRALDDRPDANMHGVVVRHLKPSQDGDLEGEILKRLRVASSNCAWLELFTSNTVAIVGWAVELAGWVPMACQYVGRDWPITDLGPWTSYTPLVPVGGVLLGLGVAPADEETVQTVGWAMAVQWCSLGAVCSMNAWTYYRHGTHPTWPTMWAVLAVLNFFCSSRLAWAVWKYHSRAPRLLLIELWKNGRILCTTAGIICIGGNMLPGLWQHPRGLMYQDPYFSGMFATSISFAFIPLFFPPRVRDVIRQYLSVAVARATLYFAPSRSEVGRIQHSALASLLSTTHQRGLSPEEALEIAADCA